MMGSGAHPRFPLLFSPLRIGPALVKNRIVSTSHDAHFGAGGHPTDRYLRYHVEKAKGGAGLVQAFGTTGVHPSSPGGAGSIQNVDDSIIPHFQRSFRAIGLASSKRFGVAILVLRISEPRANRSRTKKML